MWSCPSPTLSASDSSDITTLGPVTEDDKQTMTTSYQHLVLIFQNINDSGNKFYISGNLLFCFHTFMLDGKTPRLFSWCLSISVSDCTQQRNSPALNSPIKPQLVVVTLWFLHRLNKNIL